METNKLETHKKFISMSEHDKMAIKLLSILCPGETSTYKSGNGAEWSATATLDKDGIYTTISLSKDCSVVLDIVYNNTTEEEAYFFF